jgi:hypothetical protein
MLCSGEKMRGGGGGAIGKRGKQKTRRKKKILQLQKPSKEGEQITHRGGASLYNNNRFFICNFSIE